MIKKKFIKLERIIIAYNIKQGRLTLRSFEEQYKFGFSSNYFYYLFTSYNRVALELFICFRITIRFRAKLKILGKIVKKVKENLKRDLKVKKDKR